MRQLNSVHFLCILLNFFYICTCYKEVLLNLSAANYSHSRVYNVQLQVVQAQHKSPTDSQQNSQQQQVYQQQTLDATIYLGNHLQPFLLSFDLNSPYIWVRNKTCLICQQLLDDPNLLKQLNFAKNIQNHQHQSKINIRQSKNSKKFDNSQVQEKKQVLPKVNQQNHNQLLGQIHVEHRHKNSRLLQKIEQSSDIMLKTKHPQNSQKNDQNLIIKHSKYKDNKKTDYQQPIDSEDLKSRNQYQQLRKERQEKDKKFNQVNSQTQTTNKQNIQSEQYLNKRARGKETNNLSNNVERKQQKFQKSQNYIQKLKKLPNTVQNEKFYGAKNNTEQKLILKNLIENNNQIIAVDINGTKIFNATNNTQIGNSSSSGAKVVNATLNNGSNTIIQSNTTSNKSQKTNSSTSADATDNKNGTGTNSTVNASVNSGNKTNNSVNSTVTVNVNSNTSVNASTVNHTAVNGSSVNGSSVNGSSVNGSSVNGSNVNGSSVNGSNLNGSKVNGSNVNGYKVNGSNVNGSNVNVSNVNVSNVNGSNVNGSKVNGSKVNGSNVNGSNVNGSNVNGSNVNGSNVNGSNVNGSNVNGSNVNGSNVNGSNVNGSNVNSTTKNNSTNTTTPTSNNTTSNMTKLTTTNTSNYTCQELSTLESKVNKNYYSCDETCKFTAKSVQFEYGSGALQGVVVNDALSFDKNVDNIMFTNFLLVYAYVNVSILAGELDGVFGLPCKNNIVLELNQSGLIQRPVFSLYLHFDTEEASFPSILFGGANPAQMISTQLNFTRTFSLNGMWAFKLSCLRIGTVPCQSVTANITQLNAVLTTKYQPLVLPISLLQAYVAVTKNSPYALDCTIAAEPSGYEYISNGSALPLQPLHCTSKSKNIPRQIILPDLELALTQDAELQTSVNGTLFFAGSQLLLDCIQTQKETKCNTLLAAWTADHISIGFLSLQQLYVIFDLEYDVLGLAPIASSSSVYNNLYHVPKNSVQHVSRHQHRKHVPIEQKGHNLRKRL